MLPVDKRKAEIYLKRVRTLHKNAYTYFALAGIIVFSTLVLHSYPKFQEMQQLKSDIRETETKINEQEEKKQQLQKELEEIADEYEIVLEEWKPILDQVLPQQNPTDQVVRFLEEFSLASDTKSHPMKIENISFSSALEEESYSVLPFRMSVEADEYNFILFLERVKNSGSLKKSDFYKLEPVPIMSIESISVNLPEQRINTPRIISLGDEGLEVETFIFTVEMEAYFREEVNEESSSPPLTPDA